MRSPPQITLARNKGREDGALTRGMPWIEKAKDVFDHQKTRLTKAPVPGSLRLQ